MCEQLRIAWHGLNPINAIKEGPGLLFNLAATKWSQVEHSGFETRPSVRSGVNVVGLVSELERIMQQFVLMIPCKLLLPLALRLNA